MTADKLYELLLSELPLRNACIVSHRFDEQHFGSFAITFSVGGEERTILNDRGELATIAAERGPSLGQTLFADFRNEDADTIVNAVLGIDSAQAIPSPRP